jgi:hypothetical protein
VSLGLKLPLSCGYGSLRPRDLGFRGYQAVLPYLRHLKTPLLPFLLQGHARLLLADIPADETPHHSVLPPAQVLRGGWRLLLPSLLLELVPEVDWGGVSWDVS